MTKHTYKEFITGKIRFTRGEFSGWTKGMGIIGAKYAIFHNRSVNVMVPEYLLTQETRASIVRLKGGHHESAV